MSISEGKKRCKGEGKDLKMKAEGEASHYNWTRLIGHCCQKRGAPFSPFFHSLPFTAGKTNLAPPARQLWYESEPGEQVQLSVPGENNSLFYGFGQVSFLKAEQALSTRQGIWPQSQEQGMITPLRRSKWLDWVSHSKKSHPNPHETAVSSNKDTGQHKTSGLAEKPATEVFASNLKTGCFTYY